MKIEMGESLLYSWLRHVKGCQITQMNWKVSPQWTCMCEAENENLMREAAQFFMERYGLNVFKENGSTGQLIRQAECDVLGLSFSENQYTAYGVDVAFHELGLSYGNHEETVSRVIKKCLRTAMRIRGYLNAPFAEIVFASPRIHPKEFDCLTHCVDDMNRLLKQQGLAYSVKLIANEAFDEQVLSPVLTAGEQVSDTSELFLRSYQLCRMFDHGVGARKPVYRGSGEAKRENAPDAGSELKVGRMAQTVLRTMLENGAADEEEVRLMQTPEYSRRVFHLNYPLLAKKGTVIEQVRYYAKPLSIRSESYYLCSQWFETESNNDRPFLMKWIEEHGGSA